MVSIETVMARKLEDSVCDLSVTDFLSATTNIVVDLDFSSNSDYDFFIFAYLIIAAATRRERQ